MPFPRLKFVGKGEGAEVHTSFTLATKREESEAWEGMIMESVKQCKIM